MASRLTTWVWYSKQGRFEGHDNWHARLPAGLTFSSVTAQLHRNEPTSARDPNWLDRSDLVQVSAEVVTGRNAQGAEVVGQEGRAFDVFVEEDPDAQPDVTDEPTPGDSNVYRIQIVPIRADNGEPMSLPPIPFRIMP